MSEEYRPHSWEPRTVESVGRDPEETWTLMVCSKCNFPLWEMFGGLPPCKGEENLDED